MHSAVMQNEDYIKFANANTVEVVCLGSLDQAVQAGDKKAGTYEAVVNGQKVQLMIEWPNLTYDEMIALNSSPGGQYNDTGKIPYTCIVDPHTLKQVWKYSGGSSAKTIQEAVKEARKTLDQEHGKGVPRKDYRAFCDAESNATKLTADGDYGKAIAAIQSASKNADEWPQDMKSRIDQAKQAVVDAATSKLDEIESAVDGDAVQAKRDLDKLSTKVTGTGLEARVKEIAKKIAAGAK